MNRYWVVFVFASAVLTLVSGCVSNANAPDHRLYREVMAAENSIPASRGRYAPPRNMPAKSGSVQSDRISTGSGNFQTPTGHQMAFTAYLRISVENIRIAIRQTRELALKLGGYVKRMDDTSAVLAIPVQKADGALAELTRFGVLNSLRIEGEDVTQQSINLSVRLENLEKSRQRLLALLSKAGKVDEMVKVENAITRVTTELERLQAQQKNLQNRIQFVTIHVSFYAAVSRQPSRNLTPIAWVNQLGENLLAFNQSVSYDSDALIFGLTLPAGFVKNGSNAAVSGSNCVIELYSYANAITATHWYGSDYAGLKFYEPMIEKALAGRFKVPVALSRCKIDGYDAVVYTVKPVIGGTSYTYRAAVAVVKSKVKVLTVRAKSRDFEKDLPEAAWKKLLESVSF